jgi:O-antigen/teichoic acid export membrane protein
MWRVRLRPTTATPSQESLDAAAEQLRLPRVMTLGFSNLLNLIFMNADILLLGALANTHEVGRYSAACKPLYVIFMGFWLLTDVLYPHIAAIKESHAARRSLFRWLAIVALASSAFAGILGWLAPQILTIIYGSTMGADGLFRILLIAMPLDFCFSLLWTVLVSRGFDRLTLYTLAVGAAVNVALNLIFIPRFQATAAAWITAASYALVLLIAFVFVLRNDVLSRTADEEPVPIPSEYAL